MSFSDYDRPPHPVRPDIRAAHQQVWDRLSRPGSHWSGAERVAIAAQARAARTRPGSYPQPGAEPSRPAGPLPAAAAEAAHTIALDAQAIDRAWFRRIGGDLGDGAYVELAAVAVQLIAVDAFATALGASLEPLPSPQPGAPDAAQAADELADVGAFVPMLRRFPGPNVGRALSLVPQDNASFLALVASMYALRDFEELVWERPLSRPQVELVAARVSALHECFY